MNAAFDKAEKIARAVLYEGYMLYPYRASSTKNRQRVTFGTLYPEHHSGVVSGAEKCRNQSQCLFTGTASSVVSIRVRFLQMQSREVEGVPQAFREYAPTREEAIERMIDVETAIAEILNHPRIVRFEIPASLVTSDLRNSQGDIIGRIRKTQLALSGRLCISAEPTTHRNVFRLTVEVLNATPYANGSDVSPALLASFASAHTVIAIRDGELISLLDPPEHLRADAAACRNLGVYPVLVGEPGEHEVMLASPIILYDYPQVAPESAGDFFDGTEIDELLTLRVMTLTDQEKSEMRDSDERVRELLERTETNAREQLQRTHGTIRPIRPINDEAA